MKTKITIRPTAGLAGSEEYFWMVTRDGRLHASGMEANEADAMTVACMRAEQIARNA